MKECITHHHACDCREAKFAALRAEVATLREENERLRGSRDAWLASDDCFYWTPEAQAERDHLRAENERLKAAGRQALTELSWLIQQTKARPGGSVDKAFQALREALGEKPKEVGSG